MTKHDRSVVLRTLAEQLAPEHAALVVVDMQNDFCADGGYLHRARAASGRNGIDAERNLEMARRIQAVASRFRDAGAPVVWLRSIYDFKYLRPAHIAKRDGEGCCLEGQWGADWFEVAPDARDLVVTKHTFSGFHETPLHELLQARGIETLVFAGVATNVCVESTLRDAFFLGYYVVLAEDCVGSSNPVGHEGTLSTVRVNFGAVIESPEIARYLSR